MTEAIIAHLGIMLFTAAFVLTKALADSRYNDNKQWHIWQTGFIFSFGLLCLNIVKINDFEKWWLIFIGWLFAQPFFEYLRCYFMAKADFSDGHRPKLDQERTLHLDEFHSSLPEIRITKMWQIIAWDLFRIAASVTLYVWLR